MKSENETKEEILSLIKVFKEKKQIINLEEIESLNEEDNEIFTTLVSLLLVIESVNSSPEDTRDDFWIEVEPEMVDLIKHCTEIIG